MKKIVSFERSIPVPLTLLAGLWLAMPCGVGVRSASAQTEQPQPAPKFSAEDSPEIAQARQAVRQRYAELAKQERTAPVTYPPAGASQPVATPSSQATNSSPPAPQPAAPPLAAKPAVNLNAPAPEITAGKTLYSFQATDLELRAALASFARANNLNIVPDNDVTGAVTLDVRDLPLDLMMRALLEASDCSWHQEGGLIRVRNTETRTFIVDYLRLSRNGIGHSSATLNSATAGGTTGSGGGGAASSGGAGGAGGTGQGGSSVNLIADNQIDFWKELKDELGFILTPIGKERMSINMTAGILQITDRPSALKRAENYLNGVDKSIHRQVDLEAKIYDVTLSDQFQFGIDWVHVAEAYGGMMGFGAATLPSPIAGGTLGDSALSGLNRLVSIGNSGGNANTLVFTNFNTAAAVNALKQQGNVEVISKPRIRTLNNQTALIKVGTETPFFSQTFQANQSQSGNQTFSGDQITTITVGTILSITPQISDNDYISLDISPVLSSLVATETSPSRTATAPVLDTKQASTLVRVRDGVTVVLGGLIQTEKAYNDKKVPVLGDIPGLGKLFTGTYRFKQKKELVIFVTPYIVRENESPVDSKLEERHSEFSHL